MKCARCGRDGVRGVPGAMVICRWCNVVVTVGLWAALVWRRLFL